MYKEDMCIKIKDLTDMIDSFRSEYGEIKIMYFDDEEQEIVMFNGKEKISIQAMNIKWYLDFHPMIMDAVIDTKKHSYLRLIYNEDTFPFCALLGEYGLPDCTLIELKQCGHE